MFRRRCQFQTHLAFDRQPERPSKFLGSCIAPTCDQRDRVSTRTDLPKTCRSGATLAPRHASPRRRRPHQHPARQPGKHKWSRLASQDSRGHSQLAGPGLVPRKITARAMPTSSNERVRPCHLDSWSGTGPLRKTPVNKSPLPRQHLGPQDAARSHPRWAQNL